MNSRTYRGTTPHMTGFTIAELMVVVAIIVILAGAGVMSGRDMIAQARQSTLDAQAAAMGMAVERSFVEMEEYQLDELRNSGYVMELEEYHPKEYYAFYSKQFADLFSRTKEEYQQDDADKLLFPVDSISDEMRNDCWMVAWSVDDNGEIKLEYAFSADEKYEGNFRTYIIQDPKTRETFRENPETRQNGISSQNIPGGWFGYYTPDPYEENGVPSQQNPEDNDNAQALIYWMEIENGDELAVILHARYPKPEETAGLQAFLYDADFGNANPITFCLSVTGENSRVTAERRIVCQPPSISEGFIGISNGYQYYIKSGAWEYQKHDDGSPDISPDSPMSACFSVSDDYNYYTMRVVLDSLAEEIERPHFASLQSADNWLYSQTHDDHHVFHTKDKNLLEENTPFLPGENLTLSVTVEVEGETVLSAPNSEGPTEIRHVSSLFASGRTVTRTESVYDELNDQTTQTQVPLYERVEIRNPRHLQNLNDARALPSEEGNDIPYRAVQTADIDWSDAQQSDGFTPISNAAVTQFNAGKYTVTRDETKRQEKLNELEEQGISDTVDAQNTALMASIVSVLTGEYTISNLRVDVPGAAGLFGTFSGDTLRNIALVDPIIKGGDYAGGIAGVISGENDGVTITNCKVYLTDGITNQSATGYLTASTYAGGLVGQSTVPLTIQDSSVATVIHTPVNGGTAGGLVGAVTGSLHVSGSWADCYIRAKTIGGLAGVCGDTSTFANSYSAGFVLCGNTNGSAVTAGGFTTSPATVTNSVSLFNFDDYSGTSYNAVTRIDSEDGLRKYLESAVVRAGTRYAFAAPESTVSEDCYYTYKDVTDTTVLQGSYNVSQPDNLPEKITVWASTDAAGYYVPPAPVTPPETVEPDNETTSGTVSRPTTGSTGTNRSNTGRTNTTSALPSNQTPEEPEPQSVVYVTLSDGGATLRFRYGVDPETPRTWYIYDDLNAQSVEDVPWLGTGGLTTEEKAAVTAVRFDSGIRNMPAQSSYTHWFEGLSHLMRVTGRQYLPATYVPILDDIYTDTEPSSPAQPDENAVPEEEIPVLPEEETVPPENPDVSGETNTPEEITVPTLAEDENNMPLPPVPDDDGPATPEPEPHESTPPDDGFEDTPSDAGNPESAADMPSDGGDASWDGAENLPVDGGAVDVRGPDITGPGGPSREYYEPITDFVHIGGLSDAADWILTGV